MNRQSASTLLVAASGNLEARACPACAQRVVGVGFQRTRTVEVNGSVFTTAGIPESTGHMERAELAVEEPPGFRGTSFASPLLEGLAATIEQPADLAEAAKLSRAMTPILSLAGLQWDAGVLALPEGSPLILHAGLMKFAEAIPTRHRHFDEAMVTESCALCTLLLIDWYDVYVSLFAATGPQTTALAMARIAAVLAPNTPSVAGNHGLAAEHCAGEAYDATTCAALLGEAAAAYSQATRLAPEVDMYVDALQRVRTT